MRDTHVGTDCLDGDKNSDDLNEIPKERANRIDGSGSLHFQNRVSCLMSGGRYLHEY